MATALVLSLALQQLAVAPYPCEAGAPVVVSAWSPAGPIAGLPIAAEWADGSSKQLGATDAAGQLRFVAPEQGLHRVVGVHAGVRIVAPLRVLAVPARWLYALVCVPVGLGLLWISLRRTRGNRHAPPAHDAVPGEAAR